MWLKQHYLFLYRRLIIFHRQWAPRFLTRPFYCIQFNYFRNNRNIFWAALSRHYSLMTIFCFSTNRMLDSIVWREHKLVDKGLIDIETCRTTATSEYKTLFPILKTLCGYISVYYNMCLRASERAGPAARTAWINGVGELLFYVLPLNNPSVACRWRFMCSPMDPFPRFHYRLLLLDAVLACFTVKQGIVHRHYGAAIGPQLSKNYGAV